MRVMSPGEPANWTIALSRDQSQLLLSEAAGKLSDSLHISSILEVKHGMTRPLCADFQHDSLSFHIVLRDGMLSSLVQTIKHPF